MHKTQVRRTATMASAALVLLGLTACSSSSSGANSADSKKCVIGAMNATTGSLGFVGKAEITGMKMAIKQINAAGGVKGKKLSIDLLDDQGSVNTGTTNFKRLAAKYPVIMGPGITAVAQATASLAAKNKVVMMTFVGQPEVTEGTDYVFEIVGSQNSNSQAMVDYMKKLGVTKAGILAINDAYGTNGLKLIKAAASQSGITISSTNTFNSDAFDFSPQASAIVKENPPALFLNGSGDASTPQVLKAVRDAGYKGPIVGDVTLATTDLPKIAGAAADTITALSQIDYATPDEVTKKFFTDYAAENGGADPSSLNAEGFDAVQVVAKALEKTGCATTGDKVVKALEDVSYDGVLGTHDYAPGKHAGSDATSFTPVTFKDGKFATPSE